MVNTAENGPTSGSEQTEGAISSQTVHELNAIVDTQKAEAAKEAAADKTRVHDLDEAQEIANAGYSERQTAYQERAMANAKSAERSEGASKASPTEARTQLELQKDQLGSILAKQANREPLTADEQDQLTKLPGTIEATKTTIAHIEDLNSRGILTEGQVQEDEQRNRGDQEKRDVSEMGGPRHDMREREALWNAKKAEAEKQEEIDWRNALANNPDALQAGVTTEQIANGLESIEEAEDRIAVYDKATREVERSLEYGFNMDRVIDSYIEKHDITAEDIDSTEHDALDVMGIARDKVRKVMESTEGGDMTVNELKALFLQTIKDQFDHDTLDDRNWAETTKDKLQQLKDGTWDMERYKTDDWRAEQPEAA